MIVCEYCFHSVLHMPPLDPDLYLTIVAVLDPLSSDTQRFAPILQVLHTALSIDLTIYFNPVAKLSQMPVSRYASYTAQHSVTDDHLPIVVFQCASLVQISVSFNSNSEVMCPYDSILQFLSLCVTARVEF